MRKNDLEPAIKTGKKILLFMGSYDNNVESHVAHLTVGRYGELRRESDEGQPVVEIAHGFPLDVWVFTPKQQ